LLNFEVSGANARYLQNPKELAGFNLRRIEVGC
jgi:hypothetical protein